MNQATSNMKKTLCGYVSVRGFADIRMPVPIQNMVLRNYASDISFIYALPSGEHKFPGCHMQLYSAIEAAGKNGHVGMCSSFLLPSEKLKFDDIKKKVLMLGISLHCVMDAGIIRTEKDFDHVQKISKLRRFTDRVSLSYLQGNFDELISKQSSQSLS